HPVFRLFFFFVRKFSCIGIKAERSGSKISNEKSTAQHGNIFHEHRHLHPCHHRVGNSPEIVHHNRHRHQENHQQPRSEFCFVSEQHANFSHESNYASQRNKYSRHGNSLPFCILNSCHREMI